jgi:hypothetical protein
MVRGLLNDRLNGAWHSFPWPALVFTELRSRLEEKFDFAREYVAGMQLLDVVSNQCYVSVTFVPDNLPAPPDSPAYWARLGDIPYVVTNEPLRKFNVGDRVFNPRNGQVYYCLKDGSYYADINLLFRFYPLPEFDPAFPLNDLFQRPMEEVLGVTSYPCNERLNFQLVDAAVRVEGDPGSATFRYRLECPTLMGDPLDEEAGYEAGAQVYFTLPDAAATGDFYVCLGSALAGETPISKPELWRRIELPYLFGPYLKRGVHADWCELDGQNEKAGVASLAAFERLQLEYDKIERQQRQQEPWTVATRP